MTCSHFNSSSISIPYGVAIAGVQNQGAGKESIWTKWSSRRGAISDGSTPSIGSHFEEKYIEDIRHAAAIGFSFFRFSIDWARFEPSEDHFDTHYLSFCDHILREIEACKMKPVITLFHFDYPIWFEKKGGFTKTENITYFMKYVTQVVSEFSGRVSSWVIINEPNVWAFQSYIYGAFPPGEKYQFLKAFRTLQNLSVLHNRAYTLIKALDPSSLVGSSTNLCLVQAFNRNNILEKHAASLIDSIWNYYFIDRTYINSDFIGMQYYARALLKMKLGGNIMGILQEFGLTHPSGRVSSSDIGWDLVPEGAYHFLSTLWKRYKKPVFITEIGLSDGRREDHNRISYLTNTHEQIRKAVSTGVSLIGVIWWTLTDNWEWSLGYRPKFGFYSIDAQGNRHARKSVSLIRKICGEMNR